MGVIPGGKPYTQQLREIIEREKREREAYEAQRAHGGLARGQLEALRRHFDEPSK